MTFIPSKTVIANSLRSIVSIVSELQILIIVIDVSCIESVHLFSLIDSIHYFENLRADEGVVSIDSIYDLSKIAVLVGRIVEAVE